VSINGSIDIGIIKDTISGEVINFISHSSVNSANSFNEDIYDFIKNSVFFISSLFFLHIPSSSGIQIIDGIVKGGGRFEIDFPGLIFSGSSTDDGDQESIDIVRFNGLFFIKVFNFGFSILHPLG